MQGAVDHDEVVVDAHLQRQPGKKLDRVRAELSARPGNGPSGGMGESFRRDLTCDGPIVIARDTQDIELTKQRYAFFGVGVVSDDVPQANDAVHRLRGNLLQGRLQRFQVRVYIGNDCELQARTSSSLLGRLLAARAARVRDRHRDHAPRSTGMGSSQAMADFASQRNAQSSQTASGISQALAADMSCHIRHQRTPARARRTAGRGRPTASA
jgi:hypothetical protein